VSARLPRRTANRSFAVIESSFLAITAALAVRDHLLINQRGERPWRTSSIRCRSGRHRRRGVDRDGPDRGGPVVGSWENGQWQGTVAPTEDLTKPGAGHAYVPIGQTPQ
jgi:hypothetical protein